jgi:hypothetical protein
MHECASHLLRIYLPRHGPRDVAAGRKEVEALGACRDHGVPPVYLSNYYGEASMHPVCQAFMATVDECLEWLSAMEGAEVVGVLVGFTRCTGTIYCTTTAFCGAGSWMALWQEAPGRQALVRHDRLQHRPPVRVLGRPPSQDERRQGRHRATGADRGRTGLPGAGDGRSRGEQELPQPEERSQVPAKRSRPLRHLRRRLDEVEEDTPEGFEKRKQLVRLLVESISLGKSQQEGRAEVQITYRFEPPPASSSEEDLSMPGLKNGSRS